MDSSRGSEGGVVWPLSVLPARQGEGRSRSTRSLSGGGNDQEGTTSELSPSSRQRARRLRRIHNEYRDGEGLMALWPEVYDSERSSVLRVGSLSPRDGRGRRYPPPPKEPPTPPRRETVGRTSVRQVLAKHLAAFEKGSVDMAEALETTRRYDGSAWRFRAGDLVEYRGRDLRWHLGFVVVSTGDASLDTAQDMTVLSDDSDAYAIVAPEGFRAGFGVDLPPPRPSGKMLRAFFGPTPFRYQQQLILEAEYRAVHRRSSPSDFEAVDWRDWARTKWRRWLDDPDNSEFRRFHDQDAPTEGARVALENLILEPFDLMNEVKTWDLDPEKMSPYLYCACLGSGLFVCAVVLVIQIGFAAVLLAFNVQQSRIKRDDLDEDNRRSWARQDAVWPCRPRSDGGPELSSVMVTLVAVYYLFKIVPDMCTAVVQVLGFSEANDAISKLTNLRRLISVSDEDTLKMKIGFRLYLTLNTAFDCLLYVLNLYLLWLTRDAVEILLNSLAIEFVRSIDESFCASAWFDPNMRYIRASAVEMIFRQFLDAHALEDRFYRDAGKNPTSITVDSRPPSISQGPGGALSPHYFPSSHGPDPVDDDALASSSRFVRKHLDLELRKLYGDDQNPDPRATTRLSRCFRAFRVAGFTSFVLGRYKFVVFRRWGRYCDWARWRREHLDFERSKHLARVNADFDQVSLLYGSVAALPNTFDSLNINKRHRLASYLSKYPGIAHLITCAIGYKIYCAFCNCNPFSGAPYHDPTPDTSRPWCCFSARQVRLLFRVLDTTLEFASTWIVLVFPLIVVAAAIYFPVCY